ncbi:MAG: transketolase, partial [Alphaproteobacteria bacterium]|nr:transketolase [Alphaproteobacteria bacterium]
SDLAARIVSASPDVTVSTNLGPWVNRRGIFGQNPLQDVFREQRIASAQRWEYSATGQHFELGIAEMNLFLILCAMGLSSSLFGTRLVPIGTLYDPFIARGLDALNYACYQDARFVLVGTPSGITLAPEGGAHQSIGSPLIGIAQPGLVSYEPAYADELAIVLRWAFEDIQRDSSEGGSSVYLRLSTRLIEQPVRTLTDDAKQGIVEGGYWLSRPGPSTRVVLVYQGAVAPEVTAAAGLMAEDRRGIGVLAVTSADRLYADWRNVQKARRDDAARERSRIELLLAGVPRDALIVTVIDGHPATLSWMGGVLGHRTESLGVDAFGQTGTVGELYAHYGLDQEAIMRAVEASAPGRPIRFRTA